MTDVMTDVMRGLMTQDFIFFRPSKNMLGCLGQTLSGHDPNVVWP